MESNDDIKATAEVMKFPKAPVASSPAAKADRDEKIDNMMAEGEQVVIRFLEGALAQIRNGEFKASGAVLLLTNSDGAYVSNDAGVFLGANIIGLLEITKAQFVARHALSEIDA